MGERSAPSNVTDRLLVENFVKVQGGRATIATRVRQGLMNYQLVWNCDCDSRAPFVCSWDQRIDSRVWEPWYCGCNCELQEKRPNCSRRVSRCFQSYSVLAQKFSRRFQGTDAAIRSSKKQLVLPGLPGPTECKFENS